MMESHDWLKTEHQQAARQLVVSSSGGPGRSHQGSIIWSGGSEGEGLRLGDVVDDDPFKGLSLGGGDGD